MCFKLALKEFINEKIFFVTFLAIALTGCASTKSSSFSDYSLSGEYPLNYIDTATNKIGPNFKMDFVPRAYFDAWNSGWISCLTNQQTKERGKPLNVVE